MSFCLRPSVSRRCFIWWSIEFVIVNTYVAFAAVSNILVAYDSKGNLFVAFMRFITPEAEKATQMLLFWLFSSLCRSAIAPAILSCGALLNGRHRTDLLIGFGTAGRLPEAAFLKGFNVNLAIHHSAAQLQELRTNALRAPALKASLTDSPSVGQLPLVHMQYLHFVHLVVVCGRP